MDEGGVDIVDALADAVEASEGVFRGGNGVGHTEDSSDSSLNTFRTFTDEEKLGGYRVSN
ncbi:protein of unknown function [Agreia sp. COWG]|nr:protein of unknown function [Agreia sp. COWG]